MHFKLSPADHPPIVKYMSADKTCRPQARKFWWEVSKLKTFDGKACLTKLMAGLLSIPVSNADSERGMLRKIHTDQWPSLSQETLISLITMKFNSIENCYESTFTEDLLKKCKKATSIVVKN